MCLKQHNQFPLSHTDKRKGDNMKKKTKKDKCQLYEATNVTKKTKVCYKE